MSDDKENVNPAPNAEMDVGGGAEAAPVNEGGENNAAEVEGNGGEALGNVGVGNEANISVSAVLDGVSEEKLLEICRGAIQRMGMVQKTEFAAHFAGVLGVDLNAFAPIIEVRNHGRSVYTL